MQTRKRIASIIAVAAIMAAIPQMSSAASRGEAELKRLLGSHFYFGRIITPDVKAATGDPNIPVIDQRRKIGSVASCYYSYRGGYKKGRVLVCQ